MAFEKAKERLTEYSEEAGLRRSKTRQQILEVFLSNRRHLTAEELHELVREKYPSIGQATVYRALNLFCEAAICRALQFGGEAARYEALLGHEHHDHLVCEKCGRYEEVVSPRIEELQQQLAEDKGYHLKSHRLVLYGVCPRCHD